MSTNDIDRFFIGRLYSRSIHPPGLLIGFERFATRDEARVAVRAAALLCGTSVYGTVEPGNESSGHGGDYYDSDGYFGEQS